MIHPSPMVAISSALRWLRWGTLAALALGVTAGCRRDTPPAAERPAASVPVASGAGATRGAGVALGAAPAASVDAVSQASVYAETAASGSASPLAEGAPAIGGDGFDKLWPAREHVAIGGKNTILVDRVGAEYLGLFDSKALGEQLGGYTTSPLISRAALRFGLDIRAPELRGNGVASIAAHPPTHYVAMAPFAIHDDDARPSLAPRFSP